MLQIRRRFDLGEEAVGANHRRQFGLEDLERDLPVVAFVLGQVDGGHSALSEFAFDEVAAT